MRNAIDLSVIPHAIAKAYVHSLNLPRKGPFYKTSDRYLVFNGNCHWYARSILGTQVRFITPKKAQPVKTHNKQWSFESSRFNDIRWDDIVADLSPQRPLIFVDTGGDTHYALLDGSIIRKADACAIEPFREFYDDIYIFHRFTYVIDEEERSKLIQWCKKVKKAEWPSSYKRPSPVTVTCIQPTI